MASLPVAAHPSPPLEIKELTKRITAAPKDAKLYLQRASLYREAKLWERSLADCEKSLKLDADNLGPHVEKARLFHDQKQFTKAMQELNAVLVNSPGHLAALELRSLVHEQEKRWPDALADSQKAMEVAETPIPEQFLRTSTLTARKDPTAALAVVDAGLAKLGPIPSLVQFAVDLEIRLEKATQAQKRLETLIQAQPTNLSWMVLLAETLDKSPAEPAARLQAWKSVANTIRQLPSRRRNTDAVRKLMAQAEGKGGP